ncbi:ABC transporter permease [Sinorhizobium americanum]|uniref:Putative spermidine/putrescine transport system permease protein n=1 Tax=Sinorhizobium americanum TaxID=194963 RepID=A0A4R2B1N5_9HYPH|nr:ABC transporter permease [Sinorhizobium americanum]TCN20331.1 putative spermidine/putrescine transport system permease protein [Sinorhizobium americanum]
MAEAVLSPGESRLLKKQLASALRRQKLRAFLLVAPLLVFVIATFLMPIAGMLARSAYSPDFPQDMPRTASVLGSWSGRDVPDESVFAAFVLDIKDTQVRRATGSVANTVNMELPGARGLILKIGRRVNDLRPPYREALVALDSQWSKPEIWQALRGLSKTFTGRFYIAALDLETDERGEILAQPEDRRIYLPLFLRTFLIGAVATLCCLLLGFPVAYWLSVLPMRHANLLMILVLLPFWTSLLVRTTAWIVLLQHQGVINSLLVWIGAIGDSDRLSLIFNSVDTMIAMTHILLPFMILPLYSVMRTIPPSYMRAARSLGANQFTAFTRVYLPQTKPGVAAGCLLVFILSLGYYITPALVGGESGTLISNMIAYHIQKSLNWGLAAALSAVLLVSVLLLYWAYTRLAKVDGLKLG